MIRAKFRKTRRGTCENHGESPSKEMDAKRIARNSLHAEKASVQLIAHKNPQRLTLCMKKCPLLSDRAIETTTVTCAYMYSQHSVIRKSCEMFELQICPSNGISMEKANQIPPSALQHAIRFFSS